MVKAPVACLCPNHVAELVGVIQEARLKHFLVQTCAIESASHRRFNVKLECFVGRCGDHALGVEALVEDKATEYRLTVDLQAVLFCQFDFAQAKVAVHNVHFFTGREFKNKIIKSAVAALPKVRLSKLDFCKCARGHQFCGGRTHQFALIIRFYAQRVIDLCANSLGFDDDRRLGNVGVNLVGDNVRRLDRLKPNGLPNARGARVEAAVRVQFCGLFACKLLARKDIILGINCDVVVLFAKRVGDVIREGCVATLMRVAYRFAVDKHTRGMVAGVDVQNDTLACPLCGNFNISAIPNRIHKIGVSQS